MTRTYTHSSEEDSMLHLAGKAYGISFSFWKKFLDFLVDGPTLAGIENPNLLSPFDRELREDYQNLISLEPRIVDVLSHKSTVEVAKLLTIGRNALRTSEAHTIAKDITLWPTGYEIPAQKNLRGFDNDTCGGLLCPPSKDWNNLTVRQSIRNHETDLPIDHFASFLWEGETGNMNNIRQGFLRGEILVRTVLCILLGPSVAVNGQGTGAGGYADRLNMRSITIPTLAFAACLARHSLTTDGKFSWVTSGGHFEYLTFYDTIIKTVSDWPPAEKSQLIQWWNGRVLSRLPGRSRATSSSNHPQPGSLAALMLQQQEGGS